MMKEDLKHFAQNQIKKEDFDDDCPARLWAEYEDCPKLRKDMKAGFYFCGDPDRCKDEIKKKCWQKYLDEEN